MLEAIFATALGVSFLVSVVVFRKRIRANLVEMSRSNAASEKYDMLSLEPDETLGTPIYIDGTTPFCITARGNLRIGPAIPGVNVDPLPESPRSDNMFQPGDPFPRF